MSTNGYPRHAFVTWQCLESQGWKCDIISEWTGSRCSRTPTVFSRSSPLDFFLFPRLKQKLAGREYTSCKKLRAALFNLLWGIPEKDHKKLSRIGLKDWDFVYMSKESAFITKTYLYNIDPLKPHLYIVKLGFTGVYIIFHISAQNIDYGYSLEPPWRGGSNGYPQSMFWAEIWKISEFFIWKFSVFEVEIFYIFE